MTSGTLSWATVLILLLGCVSGCAGPSEGLAEDERRSLTRLVRQQGREADYYRRPNQSDLERMTRTVARVQEAVVYIHVRQEGTFLGYVGGIAGQSAEAISALPAPWEILDIPFYLLFGWVRQFMKYTAGSGFFVSPDGYILTNGHVVAGAAEIRVYRKGDPVGDRGTRARLVYRDPLLDVAVLKLVGTHENLPFLAAGRSTAARIGQIALAIGYPYRGPESPGPRNPTASLGVISSVDVTFVGGEREEGFIQTDAAINPGNSGGPLIDLGGRVLGINTFFVAQTQNIGFAIPIGRAMNAIRDGILRDRGDPVENIRVQKRLNLAWEAFRAGEVKEALEHYEIVLNHRPDVGEARFMTGVCRVLAGRLEEALTAFDGGPEVLGMDRVLTGIWRQIALRRLGRSEEAEREATRLLKGAPVATWPWPILAHLAGRTSRKQFELTAEAPGRRHRKHFVEARFYMAQRALWEGRRAEAAHLFRVLAIHPRLDLLERIAAKAEAKRLSGN